MGPTILFLYEWHMGPTYFFIFVFILMPRKRHVGQRFGQYRHVSATSAKTTPKLPRDIVCTGFDS